MNCRASSQFGRWSARFNPRVDRGLVAGGFAAQGDLRRGAKKEVQGDIDEEGSLYPVVA